MAGGRPSSAVLPLLHGLAAAARLGAGDASDLKGAALMAGPAMHRIRPKRGVLRNAWPRKEVSELL